MKQGPQTPDCGGGEGQHNLCSNVNTRSLVFSQKDSQIPKHLLLKCKYVINHHQGDAVRKYDTPRCLAVRKGRTTWLRAGPTGTHFRIIFTPITGWWASFYFDKKKGQKRRESWCQGERVTPLRENSSWNKSWKKHLGVTKEMTIWSIHVWISHHVVEDLSYQPR